MSCVELNLLTESEIVSYSSRGGKLISLLTPVPKLVPKKSRHGTGPGISNFPRVFSSKSQRPFWKGSKGGRKVLFRFSRELSQLPLQARVLKGWRLRSRKTAESVRTTSFASQSHQGEEPSFSGNTRDLGPHPLPAAVTKGWRLRSRKTAKSVRTTSFASQSHQGEEPSFS